MKDCKGPSVLSFTALQPRDYIDKFYTPGNPLVVGKPGQKFLTYKGKRKTREEKDLAEICEIRIYHLRLLH